MEKISSGNLYPFGIKRPKRMKTFDFAQETISHTLKDPHSKALEPDCLSPGPAITTQSLGGEGWGEGGRSLRGTSRSIFLQKLMATL